MSVIISYELRKDSFSKCQLLSGSLMLRNRRIILVVVIIAITIIIVIAVDVNDNLRDSGASAHCYKAITIYCQRSRTCCAHPNHRNGLIRATPNMRRSH